MEDLAALVNAGTCMTSLQATHLSIQISSFVLDEFERMRNNDSKPADDYYHEERRRRREFLLSCATYVNSCIM